jgi:hypothetical protein
VAEQRAKSFGMVFNFVEEQGWGIGRVLAIKHVGDGAHLEVPIDTVNLSEFTDLIDPGKPIAQTFVVHRGSLVIDSRRYITARNNAVKPIERDRGREARAPRYRPQQTLPRL